MSRVVALGEIMGRLAAPGFQRLQQAMPGPLEATFAGAEANVAVSIAHLGGEATLVTALPDHAIADACVAEMRGLGVETRHILRRQEGRLGLFFLETGACQRPGQVIYDREGSTFAITPPAAYDWEAVFEGAEWLLFSGITPAISRNAADVARKAVAEASKRGVKIACDMNYRSKLWRWEPPLEPRELATSVMRELISGVDLFIGGKEDAQQMLGIDCTRSDDPEGLAREIVLRYPRIRHVAMTLRQAVSAECHHWAGFLFDAATGSCHHAPLQDGALRPYAITHIVDRLGGGDAFTAGLLFCFTTAELADPKTAVAFATAASCLAHSIPGDYNYTTRVEVEALMAGSGGGRVRR